MGLNKMVNPVFGAASRPASPALRAHAALWVCAVYLLATLVMLGMPVGLAHAEASVGQVTFSVGEVSLTREGARLGVAVGDAVREGDHLETGPESHVHLRMVDGAIVSLRSESALSIERYHFLPQQPEASQARLTLHRGVVRTVSGELGARHAEGFRLNTPVAAIGIRGTDFSTLSLGDMSRVSVRQGGIAMAPFSAQCAQASFGACETAGARELFSHLPGAMLEARLGMDKVSLTFEGTRPDDARPPHPREDSLVTTSTLGTTAPVTLSRGASAPGAESYEEGLQRIERYLAQPGLAADAFARGEAAGPAIQPRDRQLVAEPQVAWGRWSEYAEDSDQRIARLIHDNRQYAGLNSVFALVETVPGERHLPESGRAHFNLNHYEAHIKRGSSLEAATISHPGLVVDFEQQRFATRLDVHAASLPGTVHVVGGGNLLDSGHLRSDGNSPSRLEGVLSPGAAEAGLLFEYQVSPGVDAVGATHWVLEGR